MNKQWNELKATITDLRDNYGTGTQREVCGFLVRLMNKLEKQMSCSENPNKWIPVSESMPPIGQDVLVCDLDGYMYITYLHLNGTWGFEYCGNKIKNVVAWQELPTPFKPQESEDKE